MEPIFGLRFGSNEQIQPSPQELRAFLTAPKKAGAKTTPADDVAAFSRLLDGIAAFEAGKKHGVTQGDYQTKLTLGALSHSKFFSPGLKTAVEHYLFQRAAFEAIDLRKPAVFIKSAEEEIAKLNPKKKDDLAKIERLRSLADQRAKDLAALTARRAAVAEELGKIAGYLADNLELVRKRCEAFIVRLVSLQVGGEKKNQLIEEIKTHYKEQVRDALLLGPVTKSYVEELQTEVANLSAQLSQTLLEDIYAMTRLFEAVHDHAKSVVDRLRAGLASRKPPAGGTEFDVLDKAVGGLMTDFKFDPPKLAEMAAASDHDRLLIDKRNEMLNHLFSLLDRGAA